MTWLDATAQADLVRRGEASPAELVDAAIARIEALNPRLDAVIRTRFDQARAQAAGALPDGPFRGVPILLKDLGCLVAGEVTAFGLGPLKDVECPVCHGLRAGGKLSASVVTVVPSSGTLVRPNGMKPAARNCPARYEVTGQATSFSAPSPKAVTSPATRQPTSLSRIGTPRNGPSGSAPAA